MTDTNYFCKRLKGESKMKKGKVTLLALIAAVTMIFAAACGEGKTDGEVSVFAPDGATAIALAEIINGGGKIGGRKLSVNIVSPSNIADTMKNEQADLVIAPTNAPAKMNTMGKPYSMIAAVTHGNLYMVGVKEAASLEALKGKIVGVIGLAATPDIIFRYILKENHIEYAVSETPIEGKVALKYYADGSALLGAMKANHSVIKFGVVGEPLATTALEQLTGSSICFDLQQLYGAISGGASYPQSVLAVKDSLKSDRQFLDALLKKMSTAAKWAEGNPAEAVAAINSCVKDGAGTSLKNLSKAVIERCNIDIVRTVNCKKQVKDYFTAISSLDNELGLTTPIPAEQFYFEV